MKIRRRRRVVVVIVVNGPELCSETSVLVYTTDANAFRVHRQPPPESYAL